MGIGVTTVALFAMHGSIYLAMKTEGDLQQRVPSACIYWIFRGKVKLTESSY